MACGCQDRARWLSGVLFRWSFQFQTSPGAALARLLAVTGAVAAAGFTAGYLCAR